MKILLTNHALNYPGGSETACYTLAEELVRLGHEVDFVCMEDGMVTQKLKEIGCTRRMHGAYDLGIFSHHQPKEESHLRFAKTIRICHGTTPKLEQPQPGADAYVAISEEVQAHLKGLGYESTVIRNGINCERFKPIREPSPELKRVLLISASEKAESLARKACDTVGATLTVTNKVKNPRWDMETLINEHDLVISLGRGALEGMACGRPVIVWDWRNYQGNMGDGIAYCGADLDNYATHNFSGRWHKISYTPPALAFDLVQYSFLDGMHDREWVLQNANIRKTAQQYLEL